MALVAADERPNSERFLPPLRGVPRMKVDSNSSIKELHKWDQMYQCRFFNPRDRIVTENDVTHILSYQGKPDSPFSGLNVNLRHQQTTQLRPRHFSRLNQRAHENKISQDLNRFIAPQTKQQYPPDEYGIKTDSAINITKEVSESLLSLGDSCHIALDASRSFSSSSYDRARADSTPFISSEDTLNYLKDSYSPDDRRTKSALEKQFAMLIARKCRLRKPLCLLPPTGKKLKSCCIEGSLADAWCPWTYVTFEDDAPYTPNSFYVHNYPLLLMRIPKQTLAEPEPSQSALSPLLLSSEIDFSYFDRLPTRILSWYSLTDSEESEAENSNDPDSRADTISPEKEPNPD